jgi:hypothetical protein
MIEKSPAEIVRGVAPVFGVALIGVAVGMVAIAAQLSNSGLCAVGSAVCDAISFAEFWAFRSALGGGGLIGLGIGLEAHLE